MKRIIALFLAAMLTVACFSITAAAEDGTVIYLKEGGNGDGKTEATAMGSLENALIEAATANTDITILVVGEVTVDASANITEPERTNKLTIKGTDSSSTLSIINAKSKLWLIGGEFEICNINLNVDVSGFYFCTQLNNATFGDGIVMTNASPAIRGSYNKTEMHYSENDYTYIASPVLKVTSGSYSDIAAFAQNSGKVNLTGTVTLLFGGTASADNLTVCRNAWYCADNAVIILDGGSVVRFVGVTDRPFDQIGLNGFSGVFDKFTLVVTDNFKLSESFQKDHTDTVFYGLSGSSVYRNAASLEDITGAIHELKIEAGVYEELYSSLGIRVSADSFDSIAKIDSASGVAAYLNSSSATEPPVTDAPVTDAPVTDAPVTDAPITDAPVTDAPVTDAPETEAPKTEAPATNAPETDAPASEGGCGSFISVSALSLLALSLSVVLTKKKER